MLSIMQKFYVNLLMFYDVKRRKVFNLHSSRFCLEFELKNSISCESLNFVIKALGNVVVNGNRIFRDESGGDEGVLKYHKTSNAKQ